MLQEDGDLMFDGIPLDENARQRIMDVLTGLFWEAKKMNMH
ncbi:transcriptional regulator domain protein [Brevibacillus laterosporus GI-9]|nr:transcriptional regulator domain protein [Brevibacillus laterosporus GI-9]